MKLPNGDQAIVDTQKLRDYCLNPDHARGQHKARVFAAALGITAEHTDYVRDLFLAAARTADAIEQAHDTYGRRYRIDTSCCRPNWPGYRPHCLDCAS